MQVVNVRKYGGIGPSIRCGIVYCGRPSVLGNPFKEGVDGTRQEVIAKYEMWLRQQLEEDNEAVTTALAALKPHDKLGCWCHPLACHCDIIARVWQEIYGRKT